MAKFNMRQLLNKASLADAEKIHNEPYKVVSLSIFDLQPSENNFYSVEDIAELKSSIEMFGVKQNLTVRETEPGKYRIIAGHRRYKACSELVTEGKKQFEYVPCAIEVEPDSVTEQLLLIMTNSTTRQLTDYEKIQQVEEIKRLLTEYRSKNQIEGRTREIIAEILDTSITQVARMEAIDNNLSPEFKEELKAQNIGSSVAYELSGLPMEQQKELHDDFKDKKSIAIKEVKQKKKEIKPVVNKENTEVQLPLPGQIGFDGKTYEYSHKDIFVGPEPLTLKELRDRSGKPVWTVSLEKGGMWELVEFSKPNFEEKEVITLANLEDGLYDCFADTYGKTWIAFDHEIKDIGNYFEKEPKKYESK